ncbi:hypothetical protein JCM19992_03290 [Thermostilla marina]
MCRAAPRPALGVWTLLIAWTARNLWKKAFYSWPAKAACFVAAGTFGNDHPNTLLSLYLLIHTLRGTVDDAELEPLYRRAGELAHREYQGSIPGSRESYRQLFAFYRQMENDAMVVRVLEYLLPLEEHAWFKRKTRIAFILQQLACAHRRLNDFEAAEHHYRRALDVLGPQHRRETAVISADLAMLYHEQGKFGRAEELYRRALSIRETNFATDKGGLADVLERYALLCHDRRDFQRAESFFRRASALYREALGECDHAARVNFLLGILAYDQGNAEKGRELLEQTIAFWEQHAAPDSPTFLKVCWQVAEGYQKCGDFDAAEKLYRRLVSILEQSDSPSLDLAHVLFRLADLYFDCERFTEAEPLCLRALAIVERTQSPNDEFAQLLHSMLTTIRLKRNAARRPNKGPAFFCSGKR